MANHHVYNKYFKEVKILFSLLGIWPYTKGNAAKYQRIAILLHSLTAITLMVKYLI